MCFCSLRSHNRDDPLDLKWRFTECPFKPDEHLISALLDLRDYPLLHLTHIKSSVENFNSINRSIFTHLDEHSYQRSSLEQTRCWFRDPLFVWVAHVCSDYRDLSPRRATRSPWTYLDHSSPLEFNQ